MNRYKNGVLRKEFEEKLFGEEFGGSGIIYYLKIFYVKLRPHYLETFDCKLGDIIEECEEEGYIRKTGTNSDERLIVRSKGKEFVKLYYFPKLFLSNAYVKAVLISIIVLFATNYITQNILEKVNATIELHE